MHHAKPSYSPFRLQISISKKIESAKLSRSWRLLLLLDIVELLPQDLVHGEHVHLVLFEDQLHLLVAPDLAFVVRVLQVARLDVLPYLLDGLGTRELLPSAPITLQESLHFKILRSGGMEAVLEGRKKKHSQSARPPSPPTAHSNDTTYGSPPFEPSP